MIKIGDYEMKNSLREWTVNEYEKIIKIINNEEYDFIDKYIKVMEFLGVPDYILENMTDEDFFNIVKNILDNNIEKEYKRCIEIDGYIYSAYKENEKYKLTVRDMSYIEKVLKSDVNDMLSRIMAIIYKRDDLSNKEHYDESHLEYKAKLFKNVSADIVIPYLLLIEEKIVSKLIYLNEKQAT
jgi:hypothetical protein